MRWHDIMCTCCSCWSPDREGGIFYVAVIFVWAHKHMPRCISAKFDAVFSTSRPGKYVILRITHMCCYSKQTDHVHCETPMHFYICLADTTRDIQHRASSDGHWRANFVRIWSACTLGGRLVWYVRICWLHVLAHASRIIVT